MGPSSRQVWVGSHMIGLQGLDEILASVQSLQLDDASLITSELLNRVRERNYGPVTTPALVANEEIMTMGRVPTLEDIKKLLAP